MEEIIDTKKHLEERINDVLDGYPEIDEAEKQKAVATAVKDLTAAYTDIMRCENEKELESKKIEESKKSRKANIISVCITAGVSLLTVGCKMIFTAIQRKKTAAYEKEDIPTLSATKEAIRDSNKLLF